jgi:hypothetical protein
MIRITCTNCQKPLSLDEAKLPMREVSFPCPVCKAKLTVDRRELETTDGESAVEPPRAAQSRVPQDDDDHANELGAKALIVGKDDPALRQAAKLIGFLPVHHSDPARAREYYLQEFPQLVILNPPQATAPPLESMGPITAVVPSDRRKSFFVLVADNLRTMDGNAAFLYGVNLVVATKDLGQFSQIYREAHTAHERLYAPMTAVLREKELA